MNSCPCQSVPLTMSTRIKGINLNCCPYETVWNLMAEGDSPQLTNEHNKECLAVKRKGTAALANPFTKPRLQNQWANRMKRKLLMEHGSLLPLLIRTPSSLKRFGTQRVTRLLPLLISPITLQWPAHGFPRKPCVNYKLRQKWRYSNVLKECIGLPPTQSSDLRIRHAPFCRKRSSADAKTMALVMCGVKPAGLQWKRK